MEKLDASTPADPGTLTDAGTLDPRSAPGQAIAQVLAAIAQARAVLQPHLPGLPAGRKRQGLGVPTFAVAAMPNVVRLLRDHPDAATGKDLAALDEAVALATSLKQLAAQIGAFQAEVATSGRVMLADAWFQTRDVYAGAQRQARVHPGVAALIEPLRVALHQGSRTAATQRRADAAQRRLDAAKHRADVAQHRATIAQQRAGLARQAAAVSATALHGPAPAAPGG